MGKSKHQLSSFEITEFFREEIMSALVPFMKNYSKSMYINYKLGYNIEIVFKLNIEKINLKINYNLKDDFIDIQFENFNKNEKITLYDLILNLEDKEFPLSKLQPKKWEFGDSISNNIKYIKFFVTEFLNTY